MRAYFKSVNLIGDGIAVGPALRAWHRQHPEYEIDLLTLPDFIADIYTKMGVPVNVITKEEDLRSPYDFSHVFDVNAAFTVGEQNKVHITEAYGRVLLGDELPEDFERAVIYEPEEEEHPIGLMLISPFSRSCASNEGKPPNKMISWSCWLQIVTLLRTYGEIGVLGGPGDRMPLAIADNEYYCGLPLNTVALMLRDAKMFVTIDNGLAHLAASQKTKMIEMYPSCLGIHWVGPIGNPNAFLLQMDPAQLSPAQAVLGIRNGLRAIVKKGTF